MLAGLSAAAGESYLAFFKIVQSSPGFPRMHVQFVDVNEMFSRHRSQIDAMVDLFTTAGVTLLMPGPILSRNWQSAGFSWLPDQEINSE